MKKIDLDKLVLNQWVFLLGLFLLLLLVTVNHPMYCDEGFWHYIAKAWSENGLVPYVDSIENKPPGIYYLFMLSNWLFGVNVMFVRLLGVLSILLSALLVKRLIHRFSNEAAGILGMIIFGMSNTWFAVDGQYPAVTEVFMMLFVLLALSRLTKQEGHPPNLLDLLITGLFLGTAISFKQIALFSSFALILFYLIVYWRFEKVISHIKHVLVIVLAAIFAHFLFVLPVLLSGASVAEYFQGVWFILLDEGSQQGNIQALYDFLSGWFDSKLFIFWLFIPISLYKPELRKSKYFIAFVVWLLVDFVAVSLPGTFHEHQYRQFLFPASALCSISILSLLNVDMSSPKLKSNFTYFLVGIILVLIPLRQVVINGYFEGFPNESEKVGKWIKQNTDNEATVYVFAGGDAGQIMAYSERVCPIPNFNLIFINTLSEYEALNHSLLNDLPDVLVTINNQFINNELLQKEIISQYKLVHQQNIYNIYFLEK